MPKSERDTNVQPLASGPRSWRKKFHDAGVGAWLGTRGQSSFAAHFICGVMVVGVAAALQISLLQWGLLIICITMVLAAEMFNSALEVLAKAIDEDYNQYLADGLNIASGAVLVTALGSAIVGSMVFAARLGEIAGWW